jgi:hypothetical protein
VLSRDNSERANIGRLCGNTHRNNVATLLYTRTGLRASSIEIYTESMLHHRNHRWAAATSTASTCAPADGAVQHTIAAVTKNPVEIEFGRLAGTEGQSDVGPGDTGGHVQLRDYRTGWGVIGTTSNTSPASPCGSSSLAHGGS